MALKTDGRVYAVKYGGAGGYVVHVLAPTAAEAITRCLLAPGHDTISSVEVTLVQLEHERVVYEDGAE